MSDDHARRAPDPAAETTDRVDGGLLSQIIDALADRHALDETELDGRTGAGTGWLRARIGPETETWEVELFVRNVGGEALDGALGVLVDYLDGFLEGWTSAGREGWAPLDWEGRPYALDDDELCVVYVRGEVRNLDAERARDRLLESS
jgi:hypothetical protein